jgi:hypothetical protein
MIDRRETRRVHLLILGDVKITRNEKTFGKLKG